MNRRRLLRLLSGVAAGSVLGVVGLGPMTIHPAYASGRPKVTLDRLSFPDVPQADIYKKHLLRTLKREVRRAEWGAGRGSVIEYRFTVEALKFVVNDDGVLNVACTAIGRLPKGKSARSQLNFGGSPKERQKLTFRVLDIVAHGVITRLAELERVRRGQLRKIRPAAPPH